MPPPDARADTGNEARAAVLLAALQGLDLSRADGRAGIGSLLAELERLAPGALAPRAAPRAPRPQGRSARDRHGPA